jgi:hypothetical protein
MDPFVAAPEAMYSILFLLIVAIVFMRAWWLVFCVVILVSILLYYVRGTNIHHSNDVETLMCPCDGFVTEAYCDKRRFSYMSCIQSVIHKHIVVSPYWGRIIEISKQHKTVTITIHTLIGKITVKATSKILEPRLLIHEGDEVVKGQLLCFLPAHGTIELMVPMYEFHIQIQKGAEIEAGEAIGRIQQVWVGTNAP